jgi:hypothetical protein
MQLNPPLAHYSELELTPGLARNGTNFFLTDIEGFLAGSRRGYSGCSTQPPWCSGILRCLSNYSAKRKSGQPERKNVSDRLQSAVNFSPLHYLLAHVASDVSPSRGYTRGNHWLRPPLNRPPPPASGSGNLTLLTPLVRSPGRFTSRLRPASYRHRGDLDSTMFSGILFTTES